MTDIVALHQAVVTAQQAILHSFDTDSSHAGKMYGWIGFAMLSTLVAAFYPRVRNGDPLSRYDPSSILVPSAFTVLGLLGFLMAGSALQEKPYGTPALQETRTAACDTLLGEIRNGQVRWMLPEWQGDVAEICGTDRLAAAANAPSSRYPSIQ